MRVITLIGWNDPDGVRHEAGEIAEINVFDLDNLLRIGVVGRVAGYETTTEFVEATDEVSKRRKYKAESQVNEE